MTTEDFITMLFCQIDDPMKDVPKHPLAQLYPSEGVTVGVLFALKGVGDRAFDRWLRRDYPPLFPRLPERTRLFRILTQLRAWTDRFLADPGLLCVADTYGIELLHPRREGRSSQQLGSKGTSNLRWIVGAKFAFVLDHLGRFVAWTCNWARAADNSFRPMIAALDGLTVVLGGQRIPWAVRRPGQPEGLSAGHLEHAHDDGDRAVDADQRVPCEEGRPSGGRL
jgi:hypothetical protein